MADMDEATPTYSTVSWTEFLYPRENATEKILVEIAEPPSLHLRRFILTAAFVLLIIIANIVSLLAFSREKRLRTYNNYFIINLSVLDLLVGIALVPAVLHAYLGRFPFSQTACKVMTGIAYGIFNASNLTVVVICADRHQAVYDPINHFISRSKRKAVIVNSVPWVIGLSFWIGYSTVWEFVVSFDNGDQCIHQFTINPLTNIIQKVFMFFLPLFIIAVLYLRIFMKIRQSVGGRNVDKEFVATEGDMPSTVKTATTPSGSASPTSHSDDTEDTVNAGLANAVLPSSCSSSDGSMTQIRDQKSTVRQRGESTAETKKATRTLLLIVIAFVTAWIGESIISLIYSIAPRLVIPGLSTELYVFFTLMPYANSLLNPLSYAMSQPLFRHTVFEMFSCKCT